MKRPLQFLLLLCVLCGLSVSAAFASDISITAGSVAASAGARKASGIAGANITAGQTVYRDVSTNTWKLADANLSLAASKVVGIALSSVSSGQRLVVCTYDPSFTLGGTVETGRVVIASGTNAGGICLSADAASGWYVSVLGVAIGSNKIKLDIIRSDVPK